MRDFLIRPDHPEDLRVINQTGVRQAVLPEQTLHNASWDSILSPEGRLYFSLCSELTTSEYAKLAEYDYDQNTVKDLFYAKDYLMPHERYIRDSKFHTSIACCEDGSLIMATHTTDKAPGHPAWIPEGYFSSPWEGFPGSTLFRYYPDTGVVENLGVPAPRESVYGGIYDPVGRNYYMLGFMRGHLYRYNLDSRQVVDLGQVTERHTYRMVTGSDRNIYFTTRSGYLKRIVVDRCEVEDLNILLPNFCQEKKCARSYLSSGVNGPDGKLYMAGQFCNTLSAFDPKTGKLEELGSYLPAKEYISGISNNDYVGGMAFDRHGVLWLVVCALRHDKKEDFKPPCALVRWEVLKPGSQPEFLGLVGTKERVVTTSVGVFIDQQREILYIVGTNHADEGPDVTAIDLGLFEPQMHTPGSMAEDVFLNPENTRYTTHAANLAHTWKIIGENPPLFAAKSIIPVRLWRQVEYHNVEQSAVAGICWKDDLLFGMTKGADVFVVDKQGKLISFAPFSEQDAWLKAALMKTTTKQVTGLPCYPGRQYRAIAAVSCGLSDGRKLVATEDGLLSIVKNGVAFSLGGVCNSGPVHAMTATADGSVVYGVAGDDDDLGCVFRYDDETGLRMLGRLACDGWEYGNAASCNLSSIVLHPSGDLLAIGAKDRLGCVYLCQL